RSEVAAIPGEEEGEGRRGDVFAGHPRPARGRCGVADLRRLAGGEGAAVAGSVHPEACVAGGDGPAAGRLPRLGIRPGEVAGPGRGAGGGTVPARRPGGDVPPVVLLRRPVGERPPGAGQCPAALRAAVGPAVAVSRCAYLNARRPHHLASPSGLAFSAGRPRCRLAGREVVVPLWEEAWWGTCANVGAGVPKVR